MRYIGLLCIGLAMFWTWGLVHGSRPIPVSVHQSLQQEMVTLIQDYVSERRPASSPVIFEYMWTKALSENQVKAFFSFYYDDLLEDGEETHESRSGWALLSRNTLESSKWSLDSVQVDQDALVFKDGTVIHADDELSDPAASDE